MYFQISSEAERILSDMTSINSGETHFAIIEMFKSHRKGYTERKNENFGRRGNLRELLIAYKIFDRGLSRKDSFQECFN